MTVTVNQPSGSSVDVTVCSGLLPFNWNNNTYSATGTYTVHLTNAAGCDSAAVLHLNVVNSTTSDTAVVACNGFT
jgi:hypothetical protein